MGGNSNETYLTNFNDFELLSKNDLEEIIKDLPIKIRNKVLEQKKLKNELVDWMVNDSLGGQMNYVKRCSVPETNYESEEKKIKDLETQKHCEGYEVCPLYKHGATEEGMKCPLEKQLVSRLTTTLLEEFDAGFDVGAFDKHLVSEIVKEELLSHRARMALASSSMINKSYTEEVLKQGRVVKRYEKEINHFNEVIDKKLRNKKKIRDQIIKIRKESFGLGKENEKVLEEEQREEELAREIRKRESSSDVELDIVEEIEEVE